MSEYADRAMATGAFNDPRVIYDLTPEEIGATVDAYAKRYRETNIRTGMICASVFNSRRSKSTQKRWTWKDFFPEPVTRQSVDEMTRTAVRIKRIFNQGRNNGG